MSSIIEDMEALSRLEQQFQENHNKRMEVLSEAIESLNNMLSNNQHQDNSKDLEEINSMLNNL